MEMIIRVALSSCETSGVGICLDKELRDLGYADDVVLLSLGLGILQAFFVRVDEFGMRSVKCYPRTKLAKTRALFLQEN